MDISRSHPVSIAVRAVVLLGVELVVGLAYQWLVHDPGDASADADFGGGWAMLGVLVLLATAWGAWDGRHRRFGRVAAIWCVTAAVVGVVNLIRIDWSVPRQVLLTDLPIIPPVIAALVLAPALVAALVTSPHPPTGQG